MKYNERNLSSRYKRLRLFGIAGSVLAILAGAGLLLWWFLSFRSGIFDFYQAYIVGMGGGLMILGIITAVKAVIIITNKEKLEAASAAQRPDKNAQWKKNRAMAMAFKVYLCTMAIALIFIGQAVSYTSFVVCFFSIIFAYFCYVICSMLVDKK
ncbi:MAG: hypothetical protein RR115_02730 [Hydrogenoanaerobacterium sp.]